MVTNVITLTGDTSFSLHWALVTICLKNNFMAVWCKMFCCELSLYAHIYYMNDQSDKLVEIGKAFPFTILCSEEECHSSYTEFGLKPMFAFDILVPFVEFNVWEYSRCRAFPHCCCSGMGRRWRNIMDPGSWLPCLDLSPRIWLTTSSEDRPIVGSPIRNIHVTLVSSHPARLPSTISLHITDKIILS